MICMVQKTGICGLEFLKKGKISKLNDDTAYYRIHPNGISQSFDKHLIELDKVYNQHVFQSKIQNKIKYAANSVYSFRKAKNFFKKRIISIL